MTPIWSWRRDNLIPRQVEVTWEWLGNEFTHYRCKKLLKYNYHTSRSYGSKHTLRLENQQCKQQRKSILGYGEATHSSVTMRRLDSTLVCTTWSVISTQLETSRMLTPSLVRIPKQWRDTGPSSNTSQLSPLYWLKNLLVDLLNQ